MIFLIEYNRSEGRIAGLQTFPDAERSRADELRIELEVDLMRSGRNREVVILQALSEQALRKTHRRYFDDLAELLKPLP